jgi:hypothetical protein
MNKPSKEEKKEIEKKLAEPSSPKTKKDMEDIVYGDNNNPGEKFNTGIK